MSTDEGSLSLAQCCCYLYCMMANTVFEIMLLYYDLNSYNAMNIIFCMGENVWSDGIWIKSPVAVNKWKFVYWIYSIYYVLTFKFSSEKIRITLSFKIKTNSYLSCSCFCTILSLSLSSGNWPPFFTILHDWKKLWSFNITCVTPKCYLMCFV